MEKSKGGRPKTTVNQKLSKISLDLSKISMLYKSGWTDDQVAEFIGISVVSLHKWKADNEFCLPLKDWKSEADEKVERSLYERACGYKHKAVKMFVIGGKVVKEEYIEHYPPDSVACFFWLKNRQPGQWREKILPEEDESLKNQELDFTSLPEQGKVPVNIQRFLN